MSSLIVIIYEQHKLKTVIKNNTSTWQHPRLKNLRRKIYPHCYKTRDIAIFWNIEAWGDSGELGAIHLSSILVSSCKGTFERA